MARMLCKFCAAMPIAPLATLSLLALLFAAAPAQVRAERADRSLPLTIEADKQSTVDLARQVVVFNGKVVITQGTMRITAERVEVRETPEGWRSAVATGQPGQPATFRQKRDGLDEFIDGRAERIEYDSRADTVRLRGNAMLRRLRGSTPADEVSGDLITYDNVNEVFNVGGDGGGRVRAVLTPRESAASAPPPGTPR